MANTTPRRPTPDGTPLEVRGGRIDPRHLWPEVFIDALHHPHLPLEDGHALIEMDSTEDPSTGSAQQPDPSTHEPPQTRQEHP